MRAALTLPRTRLWVEFLVLFVGVPLVLAFALPPTMMWNVLAAATFAGVVLLHYTPGFEWTTLLTGRFDWIAFLAFTLVTAAASFAAVMIWMPEQLLVLPRAVPQVWLGIMIAYPLVSAIPQELVFRPLFFRRYGDLLPAGSALWINAALFSLAHLMYRDPIVLSMTFAGGVAFAWAYHVRGSFPLACAMHAVAGCIIFTSGLGRLFYSGAVGG
ncbi:CPBP family intramembrane glutamic endopeptidase [Pontivivens insulae]|uniref:CAAX prenyl protease 2/Lysostaphin resistance protein A-like domain-containing protein n=1 Tax=Pontivivens insulae TaxID=1639689 RepID=A0A2R8AD35_9RHOB|nr:CPBP family intramembrane glutamic endopeptidase [Pontivivens insulae]RED14072.1 CAAX prenyl protease-like protein [Pontivivens insulae]SPF30146.1 hypothetical protein POI8812_02478 [Pontivivens insulae]